MTAESRGGEAGHRTEPVQRDPAETFVLSPSTLSGVSKFAPIARDPLALARSRARHPSSLRIADAHDVPAAPAHTSYSKAAFATATIRWLVLLGRRLLSRDAEEDRHLFLTMAFPESPMQRVARLRDEVHVPANRVARFDIDERPIIDPLRILAPTVATVTLAPAQLVFQLDLTARRLVEALERLTPDDWMRTGRMAGKVVTLADLVDGVMRDAGRIYSTWQTGSGQGRPGPNEHLLVQALVTKDDGHATAV